MSFKGGYYVYRKKQNKGKVPEIWIGDYQVVHIPEISKFEFYERLRRQRIRGEMREKQRRREEDGLEKEDRVEEREGKMMVEESENEIDFMDDYRYETYDENKSLVVKPLNKSYDPKQLVLSLRDRISELEGELTHCKKLLNKYSAECL